MKGLKTITKMNRVGRFWIFVWIVLFVLDGIFGVRSMLCCKGIDRIGAQYYRLFTGLLLHVNLIHIVANSVVMYFVCEFLNGKLNNYILLVLSITMGVITNGLFAMINPNSNYMVGGSPMIFSLIGLLVILQWKRKELPRFRLGTWYGNWIVGYALLSNIPFFSKGFSTLLIHMLGLVIGMIFGLLSIKKTVGCVA